MEPISQKRKPGRQPGWRKAGKLEKKLPALRVSDELYEWLESEMQDNSLATLSDAMRIKLTAIMRAEKAAKQQT